MPLVAGASLRARLERERRLPVHEVRRILREAATALAVAHRAGILHRFGIAKALGADAQTLTQTGAGRAARSGGERLGQMTWRRPAK